MKVLIVAVKSSIDVYSQVIIDNILKINNQNEIKVYNFSLDYHKPYIYRKILKQQFKKEQKYFYQDKYDKLLEKYQEYKPDIVFFFNWVAPDNILNKMKKNSKIICWAVDTFFPDKQEYEETYPLHLNGIKYFDKIFSYNIADVSMIKNNYHVQADYLPLGYDEKIYYPQAVNKDIDISFVGARSGIRIEFLNFIAEQINKEKKDIKLAIVGITMDDGARHLLKKYINIWRFKKKYPCLAKYIINKRMISPDEVANVYNRSKIVLNINRTESEAINPRTFEILGTKSLQLMDSRKSYCNVIEAGQDLIVYKNKNDLWEKIKSYLSSDIARQQIANNGYSSVKDKFSLIKCADVLNK